MTILCCKKIYIVACPSGVYFRTVSRKRGFFMSTGTTLFSRVPAPAEFIANSAAQFIEHAVCVSYFGWPRKSTNRKPSNLYRERLDEALRLFVAEADGASAPLAHVERQIRADAGGAGLRARGMAAAAAQAAGLAAAPGSAARCARRTRARASCSRRTRVMRRAPTRCGSSAAASSTGARSRRSRSSMPVRARRCGLRRRPDSAAGCRGARRAKDRGRRLAGHEEARVIELDPAAPLASAA